MPNCVASRPSADGVAVGADAAVAITGATPTALATPAAEMLSIWRRSTFTMANR